MQPMGMASRPDWDVFCKVIDDLGDIGVCWRLARQLAGEHGSHDGPGMGAMSLRVASFDAGLRKSCVLYTSRCV